MTTRSLTMEDNLLKATTEIHLFVILVLVLAFKSNMERESFDRHHYDVFATVLFILFVPVFFLACVVHKWQTVVQDDIATSGLTTDTARLQAAFGRHRLGRDKAEDRELLAKYISRLEDEVNSDFHVFISYHVRTEAAFAKALYDALSSTTLAQSGQNVRVYLDQERLEDGERWDAGFMDGLAESWIVVPIVSVGSLEPMGQLFSQEGEPTPDCDNVLLEWTAALELFARKHVKAVMPIIACDETGNEFSWALPKDLEHLEHTATVESAKKHLRRHVSAGDVAPGRKVLSGVRDMVVDVTNDKDAVVSVKGVVDAVLRFQGILLMSRSDTAMCAERIARKVSTLLDRGGAIDGDDGEVGAAADEGGGEEEHSSSMRITNPIHEAE
jgi:hypothetical protein